MGWCADRIDRAKDLDWFTAFFVTGHGRFGQLIGRYICEPLGDKQQRCRIKDAFGRCMYRRVLGGAPTRGDGQNLIVEDLVLDPSALKDADLTRIERIALSEPLLRDFVVDEGGKATVVNVVVQIPSDVPNIASAVKAETRLLREALIQDHPDLEIHIAGVAALSAAFEEAGLRDSSTLLPAVYAFILAVTYLVFRSVYAVAVTLGLILLSTLVGMGAGGWAGVQLLVRHGRRGVAIPPLSAMEAEDLYLMRAELEPMALALCGPRLSKEIMGRAEDIVDALEVESDVLARGRLNWEFHRTLYAPSGRRRLLETLERLHHIAERYMAFQFEALNNRQVSQREHREILAACRAGDLELAAARLKAHITTAGRQLKDALYGAGLG